MDASYGCRRQGSRKVPLPPYECYGHPVIPEKVYNDVSPLCRGCPYPRHGMFCWSNDSVECLRTQMMALETQWREQRQKKTNMRMNI